MLRNKQQWPIVFSALLLFSALSWADTSKVLDWTKQTLLSTLTINCTQTDAELNQPSIYYTANGWNAIYSFLGNYVDIVRAKQLYLHPITTSDPLLLKAGTVTEQNLFPNMPYWFIYIPVYIPELKLYIDFKIVVVSPEPQQEKYLIQSVNMVKREVE